MPTTRVYIDGFNLYYGIIQDNRLHWLNLEEFAKRLNRGVPVDKIIYCTAMVSSSPDDPQKANRQSLYHRALTAACPKVEILKGNFTSHRKTVPLAGCVNSPSCCVLAKVRTEKGSDVNLATRLVHDAHMGRYDRAIVVSGDSDLVESIKLVVNDVHKQVWVRNPRDQESAELIAVASNYERIRVGVVAGSQFPNPLIAGKATFHKPPQWSLPRTKRKKKIITSATCAQTGCAKSFEVCRYH
jgi:hypothetical protein